MDEARLKAIESRLPIVKGSSTATYALFEEARRSLLLQDVPELIAALRAQRGRMRELLIERSLLQILVEDVRGLLAADNANVRQRYMDLLRLELEGLDAKQQNAVPDTDEDDLPMEAKA